MIDRLTKEIMNEDMIDSAEQELLFTQIARRLDRTSKNHGAALFCHRVFCTLLQEGHKTEGISHRELLKVCGVKQPGELLKKIETYVQDSDLQVGAADSRASDIQTTLCSGIRRPSK